MQMQNQTSQAPNDPWATGGRPAYTPQSHYADPYQYVKKSDNDSLMRIIKAVVMLAALAALYYYFGNKL